MTLMEFSISLKIWEFLYKIREASFKLNAIVTVHTRTIVVQHK